MSDLTRRVALITGAASGIGRASAIALADAGATVLCADRDALGAAAVAQAIGHGAMALPLDVSDEAAIADSITQAEAAGGIDILVNAAGIIRSQPVLETTRDSFQAVLDVNLFGLFFMLQAAARAMIAAGRGGRIINIASIAGRQGSAVALQYSASKAAVISVTQSAALALIGHGITVNAIAPGFARTGMWQEIHRQFVGGAMGASQEAFDAGIIAKVPAGRLAMPEDIAALVPFLASDAACYIVGQTFNVDGGVCLN